MFPVTRYRIVDGIQLGKRVVEEYHRDELLTKKVYGEPRLTTEVAAIYVCAHLTGAKCYLSDRKSAEFTFDLSQVL